ncbi:DUF3892 domain-containing protein [Nesterenkonia halotolerans]|uniref:DUF3892 domain-containing protein n=1 Tax=Nesterenkonia halotolerans TaxID=225325 RepID=A0ABR9J6W4_9MICC|nr:DUF3892 domain-containing protein [Nesterenkonia halotolerans]MBE1514742.1 hypothetical protein [Nesterenkonia halotolerans]
MAVEITHVRYGATSKTESQIVAYQWRNPDDGHSGSSNKLIMVDRVENKRGTAYVETGGFRASVAVVRPDQGQPYLRTRADQAWTNNLLQLPEF